jgi:putative ABC transport system ATP-binding protein
MNQPSLVLVRSVSKTYGRERAAVKALRDVSFQVRQGEFVRLVGRSGSGKTTLLNLIAALDRPDSAEIAVAGAEVARLSAGDAAAHRCRKVGFVFQTYNLMPQLTAFENVLLPMIPAGQADHKRANQLLDRVALADRKHHRPFQLSGGEQQRVAIARAFANDPPLLLADEPTGNLDDENARSVMALLCRSCQERGKTLILVTHDHNIEQAADATFELRAGTLTRRQDGASGV